MKFGLNKGPSNDMYSTPWYWAPNRLVILWICYACKWDEHTHLGLPLNACNIHSYKHFSYDRNRYTLEDMYTVIYMYRCRFICEACTAHSWTHCTRARKSQRLKTLKLDKNGWFGATKLNAIDDIQETAAWIRAFSAATLRLHACAYWVHLMFHGRKRRENYYRERQALTISAWRGQSWGRSLIRVDKTPVRRPGRSRYGDGSVRVPSAHWIHRKGIPESGRARGWPLTHGHRVSSSIASHVQLPGLSVGWIPVSVQIPVVHAGALVLKVHEGGFGILEVNGVWSPTGHV